MPEDSRKRLTYEDRLYIEKCLYDRFSFAYIARKLDVHTTTIKREVLRNRIVREGRIHDNTSKRNICKYYGVCTTKGLCGPHCQSKCKSCTKIKCSSKCSHFEPRLCERLDRSPYVCNSCDLLDFKAVCDRQRMFYDALAAQEKTDEAKLNAGRKLTISADEIEEMTEVLKQELKKGHSPEYIWAHNPDMFKITVRTFYNYLDWGYFEDLKMHLPRYIRYSRTKKKKRPELPPNPIFDGRTYEDFKKLPNSVKDKAVELDCVEGIKDGCSKVILTLLFRDDRFQIMILLYAHTKEEVKRALDRIERCIGLDAFRKFFWTCLTDHGHEFNDFELLEASCTQPGEKRCKIYYCDPSRPDQKGGVRA